MRKLYLILVIFVFIILNSCDYFKLMSNKEWAEKTGNGEVDVYNAGYYNDGTNHACYWINGNLITNLENNSGLTAYSIYIAGQDIYVCGDDGSNACYWKNSNKYPLNGTHANFIFVLYGDVYVAGSYNTGSDHACYWKNGNRIPLYEPPSTSNSQAKAIFIVNNSGGFDIYIGGEYYLGSSNYCYWKNGVIHALGTSGGFIQDIYVDNNKVYSVANSNFYFIDDASYTLGTSLYSIFVKNGDIYLCGLNGASAYYWKNGNPTSLPGGNPSSIYVFGDDVYNAGSYGAPYPCYWKNSEQRLLSTSGGTGAVNFIFITSKNK